MSFSAKALVFFLLMMALALFRTSMAAVYQVGDSAGWNAFGTDYGTWAATNTFQVGDSIVFNYNPQLHNVLQVSEPDYQTCTTSAPLATFNTGSDSILLQNSGNHYFICAFHCQSGMKVPIEVPPSRNPSTPVNNPSTPANGPSTPVHNHSPPANNPSTPVNNPSPPANNPDTPTNPGFGGYVYPPPYLQVYDPTLSYGGSHCLSSSKLGLLIGVVSCLLAFYLH